MSPSKRERLRQERRRIKWQQERDAQDGKIRFAEWVRAALNNANKTPLIVPCNGSELIIEADDKAARTAEAFNQFVQGPMLEINLDLLINPDEKNYLFEALSGKVETTVNPDGTYTHTFTPIETPEWPDEIEDKNVE